MFNKGPKGLTKFKKHIEAVVPKMVKALQRTFNNLYTALRRISHAEIKKSDFVIDVGSGGLPYPGAHVACDYFSDDLERADSLKVDRPFVWASAEKLPFRDKAFDYSIASHVLEHVENPDSVLKELTRISKAGYIETPSAFYEFAVPHPYHASRCSVIDGKFVIVMKKVWNEKLDNRYFDLQNELRRVWNRLGELDATGLLTIYKWRHHIEYEVYGEPSFHKSKELMESVSVKTKRSFVRKSLIWLIYFLMRPKVRIDLFDVLACPICHGELNFHDQYKEAICASCDLTYSTYKGHLDFRCIPKDSGERVGKMSDEDNYIVELPLSDQIPF